MAPTTSGELGGRQRCGGAPTVAWDRQVPVLRLVGGTVDHGGGGEPWRRLHIFRMAAVFGSRDWTHDHRKSRRRRGALGGGWTKVEGGNGWGTQQLFSQRTSGKQVGLNHADAKGERTGGSGWGKSSTWAALGQLAWASPK
jgi:hypothetical protein